MELRSSCIDPNHKSRLAKYRDFSAHNKMSRNNPFCGPPTEANTSCHIRQAVANDRP
jgi:hypothetical protein